MNRLTWENVESATKKLANKIRKSEFRPDYLIGITTGGLFPLGLLAKELKIKNVITTTARSNNDNGNDTVEVIYIPHIGLSNKNVLLIDDIAERGFTLFEVAKAIKKACNPRELKTATVVTDVNKCKYPPDYYALKQEVDWVVFPWEQEEFGSYSVDKI